MSDEELVPVDDEPLDENTDLEAPRNLVKLDRAARALKLFREGKSIRQIAKETGYKSISGAWAAVKKAVELEVRPEAELVRGIELQRLDWLTRVMTKAIEASATNIDPETNKKTVGRGLARNVEVYLKVMERRALLLGIDIGETKDERIGPSVLVVYERDPNQEQRRKDVSQILDGTEYLLPDSQPSAALPAARLPDPSDGVLQADDSSGRGDG